VAAGSLWPFTSSKNYATKIFNLKKKGPNVVKRFQKVFFFFPKIWWICFSGEKKRGISRENIPFNYYYYYLRKFWGKF
jgi:hypothetical protein